MDIAKETLETLTSAEESPKIVQWRTSFYDMKVVLNFFF